VITEILALWPAVVLFLAGWFARDMLCRYREAQQNRRYKHVHSRIAGRRQTPRKPR
jgi:hypothetical protein